MLKKSILIAILICVMMVSGVSAQTGMTLEEVATKLVELENRIAELEALLSGADLEGGVTKAGESSSGFPIYRIGELVDVVDQTVMLNSAELKNGEYLELSFTITNTSNDKIDLNGYYAFTAKNDDGVLMETDYYNCNSASLDTVLIPGDKVKGSVCFTYADPAPIRIYYEPDYSRDDIYVWEITK